MIRFKRYRLESSQYVTGGALFTIFWFLPALFFDHGTGAGFRSLLEATGTTALTLLAFSMVLICEGFLTSHLYSWRGRDFALPIPVLAIQGFIAGAISGIFAHTLFNSFESHKYSLLTRSLQPGILAATWVPLLLVSLVGLRQLKARQAVVMSELQSLVQIEQTASGVLEQIRDNFENAIRSSLKVTALQARAKLTLAFAPEGEISPKLPDLIRDVATSDMRELSHAMMKSEFQSNLISPETETNNSRLKRFLRNSLNFQSNFIGEDQWWATVLLIIGTILSGLTGSISLEKQCELLLLLGLAMSLIFVTFRTIARRFLPFSRWVFGVLATTLCFSNYLIITRFVKSYQFVQNYSSWSNRLFLIIAITLFCILARLALLFFYSELKSNYDDLQYETLKRRAEHDLHNGEYVILAHKWAKHIHGTIQSQLLTTAGKLDLALEHGDLGSFNEALLNIKELLSKPDEEIDLLHRTLDEEIEHRKWLWVGLMQIEGVIEPSVQIQNLAVIKTIGQVFEEAFSNAYRHGHATHVKYHLSTKVAHELIIKISDNGVALKDKSALSNGLGLKIFAQASQSRFKISRIKQLGITTLDMVIPF